MILQKSYDEFLVINLSMTRLSHKPSMFMVHSIQCTKNISNLKTNQSSIDYVFQCEGLPCSSFQIMDASL
jgi:hypothetical protein